MRFNLCIPSSRPRKVSGQTGSEAAKLFPNAFQSTLAAFWNKADDLIKKHGLNNNEVARLVSDGCRMTAYGASKFSQSGEGKSLSTITCVFVGALRRKGSRPLLFQAVRAYNLRIEKRHASI
jgi:hypothetical protein